MQVEVIKGKTSKAITPAKVPEGIPQRERIPFQKLAIQRSDFQCRIPAGMAYFRILDEDQGALEVFAINEYYSQRLAVYVTADDATKYLPTRGELVNGRPQGKIVGRQAQFPVTCLYSFDAVGGENPKPKSYGKISVDFTPIAKAVGDAYRDGTYELIDHDAWIAANDGDTGYARMSNEEIQAEIDAIQTRAARIAQRRGGVQPANTGAKAFEDQSYSE